MSRSFWRRLSDSAGVRVGGWCASDRIAVGVYDALKEKGLRIPEDVSVVGFDDQELLAAHTRPPLTTVRIPYFEMGSWAVDRLINADGDRESSTDRPIKLECHTSSKGCPECSIAPAEDAGEKSRG